METSPIIVETPLLSEHRAAGERLGDFAGCLLPESFSGFNTEYRAARDAVALLDTNWHAVVTLSGRDRVRYLHAITSNDINSLAEGGGRLALLLNPQGHILAELEVYALPEKLLVLSHASVRERTVATLRKYILGSQVQLEDATGQVGSVAIEGPRAAGMIRQLCGVPMDDLPEMAIRDVTVEQIPCHLLKHSHFGAPGAEFIAKRDRLAALWQKLLAEARAQGGAPVGMAALNALRLEAGIPWFPADFNDAMIPHEAVLESTHISFSKGCYTGQEIVERVRSRGHVNRKRVALTFSTAAPPAPGTKLRAARAPSVSAELAAGAEVGYVTSAAFSPSAGTAIGIGYLRREHNAPGSVVEFDGGTAAVISELSTVRH